MERGRSGRLRLRVGEAYPLKGRPSIGDGDPGVTAVRAQLDLGRVRARVRGRGRVRARIRARARVRARIRARVSVRTRVRVKVKG